MPPRSSAPRPSPRPPSRALGGRPRSSALAAAAALAVLGAQRLAWRVEAVEAGLHERTLTGWTRVAWRDVELVEPRPDAIRLRARDGTSIAVATRGFAPEDRTRLERTIARRVKEAASRATGCERMARCERAPPERSGG